MSLETAATSGVAADQVTKAPARRWGAPRCGYHANAFMLWIGSRFLVLGYLLVWVLALWFFLATGRARRASQKYLTRVLGPVGFLRRAARSYRHMVEFGILLLDRAVMLARSGHGFHVEYEGLEHLTAAIPNPQHKQGPMGPHSPASSWNNQVACAASTIQNQKSEVENPGVLLLTAHFGMAEIAAPYLERMGLSRPMNIVMYEDPRDGTERFHRRHRRLLAAMRVISTTDPLAAGVKIIAALRRGEFVAMRADRTLDGKGVAVNLLGDRVRLPAGPFTAAVLSGAVVVQIYCCRVGHRKYRCVFSPPRHYENDARESEIPRAAQNFATDLEAMVRRYPYQWANFYDLWKVQGVKNS